MSSVFFWTPNERKRESWVIWFLLYDDYDDDHDHDSSDDDDHDRSYDSCDDDYDICDDDDDDHVSFIMIMDGTEDDDYDNSDYKAMIVSTNLPISWATSSMVGFLCNNSLSFDWER